MKTPLSTIINHTAPARPAVTHPRHGHAAWQTLTKVPKMTVYFWIIKLLTTAMGEATSDFLNLRFGPVFAVPAMLILLGLSLRIQFKTTYYRPWAYWFVVVMVSVFGTTAADALHVVLGIPYVYSTIFYALVVAGLFVAWYLKEGTLSIHSIYTKRRESFYWATVLAAFALGTAGGDMTATSLHWGYFLSGIIFGIVFALPAIAYWLFGLNAIFAFWASYIMTRPLGASFADWFDATKARGGLGLSALAVSIGLTVLIVIFVSYLAVGRRDMQSPQHGAVGDATPKTTGSLTLAYSDDGQNGHADAQE